MGWVTGLRNSGFSILQECPQVELLARQHARAALGGGAPTTIFTSSGTDWRRAGSLVLWALGEMRQSRFNRGAQIDTKRPTSVDVKRRDGRSCNRPLPDKTSNRQTNR